MNSVLIDDIEQLKNGVEDLISYQDISYNGLTEDDSVTISNEKCLLQKMKIWLQSDINDYHRNPEMGGIIIDNARKMRLTSDNAKSLENLIRTEAQIHFGDISIYELSVIPNTRQRRWEIKISVFDPKTKISDSSMFDNQTSIAIYME
jgi:hypothetical protein